MGKKITNKRKIVGENGKKKSIDRDEKCMYTFGR